MMFILGITLFMIGLALLFISGIVAGVMCRDASNIGGIGLIISILLIISGVILTGYDILVWLGVL